MQSALYLKSGDYIEQKSGEVGLAVKASLVLVFGNKKILAESNIYTELRDFFPRAVIAMSSTAGEILQTEVMDDTVTIAALRFDDVVIQAESVLAQDYVNSYEAGKAILKKFGNSDPGYILILSDGSMVNGSELLRGLNEQRSKHTLITGGLAGDGDAFQHTLVGLNGRPKNGLIAAIGLTGDKLVVGCGSKGGWETFGMEKTITSSEENVLYSIDDKNALALYKHYLGTDAEGLPGSALLFPLAVTLPGQSESVVRTILSIDEEKGSMTFAGNVPVGSKVRLMRANFDKLAWAASAAANMALGTEMKKPDFALLISCVGRKLILKTKIEEEVEAVEEVFGKDTNLAGFYSYGELSPLNKQEDCQLHNQTMTITTFYEAK